MTLVRKRWLLYLGWGFCIFSSYYFSLNIAITVISFLGECKFTVYLAKVRVAYYFKFGSAIKYLSPSIPETQHMRALCSYINASNLKSNFKAVLFYRRN
uniref:Uncharacterized protein n=1 Tax=Rhinolophus ferrumequinum TaxID=59479 RepID=A0A671FIY8_RHIFE